MVWDDSSLQYNTTCRLKKGLILMHAQKMGAVGMLHNTVRQNDAIAIKAFFISYTDTCLIYFFHSCGLNWPHQ